MNSLVVMLAIALGMIPPLTPEQRTRLDTAFDGRDHREEAFIALLENVRTWSPGTGDEPVRTAIDVASLLADPGRWRGDLFRIHGVLHQVHPLPRPHEDVVEWSIRLADGEVVLVYLPSNVADAAGEGDEVELPGRFYKRIETAALDGRVRSYPAFVGARPVRLDAARPVASAWTGPLVLLIAVIGLALVLLLVRVAMRPADRDRRPAVRASSVAEVDDPRPLPDDPAEALAELRRRAGGDA